MSFITLISDWNSADYYIGAIKGRILSLCPHAIIVDVNHQITSHNISQATFVLGNTYKNFPKGTIHLIAVNSEVSNDRPIIIVEFNEHFFIGADNGMFHLLTGGAPVKIIEIANQNKVTSFPELEIFTTAAADLANKKPLNELGIPREKLFKQLPVLAAIEDSVIIGKVLYIDSYQNVITNVTNELFEQVGKNRPYQIFVQSKSNRITKINKSYNETTEGELLALFNSSGYLEIAIRNGKAAELFNLTTSSTVRIVFDTDKKGNKSSQGSLF